MSLDVTAELWVNGKKVVDTATKAPTVLSGLTVTWGRATTIDQPEPATLTAQILDRGGGGVRVQDLITLGARAVVWAASPGGDRRVVFAGRISDVTLVWDQGGALLEMIATDLLADLANRYVGAEPWAQESLSARVSRIVNAVSPGTPVVVDARPGALSVSRMDVDRQTASDLLLDAAISGSAVTWITADAAGKATVRIEDPSTRPGLWVLVKGADGLWRPGPSANAGHVLDAATITRESVTWVRATADLVTRVTVRWLDQSTSPDTTERSVSLVDTNTEKTYGARGLSVGTILATQQAADDAAALLMATHQETQAWRAANLEWDLHAGGELALAMDLLDNTKRFGIALSLAPLPAWVPAAAESGMYSDGGVYVYEGGRWVLGLQTTSAIGGGESLTYEQTDRAITYGTMAPEVTWLDLLGVGPDPGLGTMPAPSSPEQGDISQRSHDNEFGLTVPDSTDPCRNFPSAMSALAADVAPKLVNLPIQFISATQFATNSGGGFTIDMRATFSAIAGLVMHAQASPPYAGNIMNTVTTGSTTAGTAPARALNVPPPSGGATTANPIINAFVWGTPT